MARAKLTCFRSGFDLAPVNNTQTAAWLSPGPNNTETKRNKKNKTIFHKRNKTNKRNETNETKRKQTKLCIKRDKPNETKTERIYFLNETKQNKRNENKTKQKQIYFLNKTSETKQNETKKQNYIS